jgi:hypothetical protein
MSSSVDVCNAFVTLGFLSVCVVCEVCVALLGLFTVVVPCRQISSLLMHSFGDWQVVFLVSPR